MTTEDRAPRLAILGAGPGGYPAAFRAAGLGMDVTLIDPAPKPGGVCLYRGCIPSKALLHVAALVRETQQAAAWGIRFGAPEIDLGQLRTWKDKVVGRLTNGLGQLSQQHGVRYLQGSGRFTNASTLHVRREAELVEVEFDYAIVATGSKPAAPRALRLESPRVMDSTAALELTDVPARLLVVGGGYIGLELGTVYAALGAQVTVVEMTAGLLPGADRDLVRPLQRRLRDAFHEILLNTEVVEMTEVTDGIQVRLSGAEVEPAERVYDKVLVAVGRVPNTQEAGLEQTAVEFDERGFIRVDGQRRTAEPAIFAIGDAAGEPMLAHKATHEARVAVDTIAGQPALFDPAAIPAVVFTDPEIAWCGLTEAGAIERGIAVDLARFPWAASGRAMTLGRSEGLTKLVVEPGSGRILGVGIVGASAGELIGEAVLAVEMGTLATDLELTIHAHPTLSETLMEAAETLYGHSPHYLAKTTGR